MRNRSSQPRQCRNCQSKEREVDKNYKMFLTTMGIVVLCAVALLIVNAVPDYKTRVFKLIAEQQAPSTMSSEQQQNIITDIRMAKRGDLISDPNQSLMKGQAKYFMVRWNDKDDNFGLSPMNNHGTIIPMGQWNIKQMSGANLRLISSGSQEWTQVMQHFFSADPDSL